MVEYTKSENKYTSDKITMGMQIVRTVICDISKYTGILLGVHGILQKPVDMQDIIVGGALYSVGSILTHEIKDHISKENFLNLEKRLKE